MQMLMVSLFIFAFSVLKAILALDCYSCEGGPLTQCAFATQIGMSETCDSPNATCYEALVEYQNGALTLVERRCFEPPDDSNETDYCSSFENPVGKLKKCITCETDICNIDLEFWK